MRIFKGDSTTPWDCVATYKDGKLYKGESTSPWDCIMTFSAPPSPPLLVYLAYYFHRELF